MNKFLPITKMPEVGDILATKTLKVRRRVVEVDGSVVTLESVPCVNAIIFGREYEFSRHPCLRDLTESYYLVEKEKSKVPSLLSKLAHPIKTVETHLKVTKEELQGVQYANGDIFKEQDTGEKVVVDVVFVRDNIKHVVLLSQDILYDGEPIVYRVTEDLFLKHYKRVTKRQFSLEENGRYCVSF